VTPTRWACVVAAVGVAVYLLLDPHSPDFAAQQYRVALAGHDAFGLWDNGWFAGHHLPGYSLVFPQLGALVGMRVAGGLAALAASALFARLAQRHWGDRAATIAGAWFAIGATSMLLSGRLTFMLGVAIGLASLLALQGERHVGAAALALLTSLASPVAGLFVAMAAVAWGLAGSGRTRWARAAVLAAAAAAPIAATSALFPEGGTEPFVGSSFRPAIVLIVLVLVVLPTRERTLRIATALYALGCVAAFALATPLGGNVTRLGALAAGPVVAGALLAGGRASRAPQSGTRQASAWAAFWSEAAAGGWRNTVLLVTLALPLAFWQAGSGVRDAVDASGDPSTQASYYAPLARFLRSRPGSFRAEIPFTANHWEAAYVAPSIPLAGGWERQLDRRYGALLYDGSLTPSSYRAWLDDSAVAYVALPDVPLDYSSEAEARMIQRGLPYLRPVWHDAHWRVFAVRRPAPMVRGAGATITLQTGGFTLRARRTGDAFVRVHDTRWWAVTSGRGCVAAGPDGMTRVRVLAPGTIRVRARLLGSACRR
jgi:hypothetical protein